MYTLYVCIHTLQCTRIYAYVSILTFLTFIYLCTYKVTAWIGEKMTVASDESYRDPTNLQGKLQKHQAFEAELTANSERVNAVEMVHA